MSGIDDKLPKALVDEMQAIFRKHPGYRTSMHDSKFDPNAKLILILASPC